MDGPWNILFFLMVVLLGSFYLLNLMLAVVFMAYVQEADVEAKVNTFSFIPPWLNPNDFGCLVNFGVVNKVIDLF